MLFKNQHEYHHYLESLGPLPEGFHSAITSLNFIPVERPSAEPYKMNMGILYLDEPSVCFAAVFTLNHVCGAPVYIGRKCLDREKMQGVFINNRIANVAAKGGIDTARALCNSAGKLFHIDGRNIFPSSTGIIGWRLPREEMMSALPTLLVNDGNNDSPRALAEAIMTTDSYPKMRVKQLGRGRIVGIAKGAGMIEPNMATMLCFITTDLIISRNDLRRILSSAVADSFNTVSVDGDQSTSDMVLAFSSCKYSVELDDFESALREICSELSIDIVRNGEGTSHVIFIEAGGHQDPVFCQRVAKAVGNSPLVKTSVYGNDPNVGRILSAIGDTIGGGSVDFSRLSICIGGELVFKDGLFDLNREKEVFLTEYLKTQSQNPRMRGYPQHDRLVHIQIDFGTGTPFQRVYASDLGYEYVRENIEYRS